MANFKTGVLITGDSKGAQKAIELTEDQLRDLNKTQKRNTRTTKDQAMSLGLLKSGLAAAAVAATAATAAMTALVKSGLQSVDSLAKTADKLGITTEGLATLRFAAEQSGVSIQTLDMGLQRFVRRVGEASIGMGEARVALKELGLDAQELNRLPLDEAFLRVSKAMGEVNSQGVKLALTQKLVDSEGVAMVNTFELLAERFEEIQHQSEILGLRISRDVAANVERANDSLNLIRAGITGFSQNLAGQFAPALEVIGKKFFEVVEEMGGMEMVAKRVFDFIVTAAGHAITAVEQLVAVWKGSVAAVNQFAIEIGEATAAVLKFAIQAAEFGQDDSNIVSLRIAGVRSEVLKITDILRGQGQKAWNEYNEAQKQVGKTAENLKKAIAAVDQRIANQPEHIKRATDAFERANQILDEFDDYLERTDDKSKEFTDSLSDLLDELDPLRKVTRDYNSDLELLEEALNRGAITAEEFANKVTLLKERFREDSLSDEAKKQAEDFARAWEEASNRIDEAFTDAFQGSLNGFKDFADSMLTGFKRLLAEMAHAAITRPILVSMGLLGPAGSVFGGVGGGGLSGGGAFGGAGLLASLGAAPSNLLFGLANTLGPGLGGNLFASAGAGALNGGLFGGGFGTLGAGFLTNQLIGGGLGGSLGGTAGGILGLAGGGGFTGLGAGTLGQLGAFAGPVGAIVGTLIGSLIGGAFGNGPKRANTGFVASQFGGNRGDPNNRGEIIQGASGLQFQSVFRRGDEGAANALVETAVGIDSALTALARAFGVDVNLRTLRGKTTDAGGDASSPFGNAFFGFAGREGDPQNVEEAVDNFVSAWIDGIADELPRRVKAIVSSVDQTAEVLVTAFEAALSIDKLLDLDVVKETAAALEDLGSANFTLLGFYDRATEQVLELSANLDGSVDGYVALNEALVQQKTAALNLTLAYQSLQQQTDQLFGNAIDRIRESLLSDEDLYGLRRQQIADLISQLGQTINPEEIAAITARIDQLSTSAFGLLDESQKQTLGQEFITFLENALSIAQNQIDLGLNTLSEREAGTSAAVSLEIQAQAAETFQAAAEVFASGVTTFAEVMAEVSRVAQSGGQLTEEQIEFIRNNLGELGYAG